MRHARADYQRIQDPAGKIPTDEPVFLLRGQDLYAPDTLRDYAARVYNRGKGDGAAMREIYAHADRMEVWQRQRASKIPDAPSEAEGQADGESGKTRLYATVSCPRCGRSRVCYTVCSPCTTAENDGAGENGGLLSMPLPLVAAALESQRDRRGRKSNHPCEQCGAHDVYVEMDDESCDSRITCYGCGRSYMADGVDS